MNFHSIRGHTSTPIDIKNTVKIEFTGKSSIEKFKCFYFLKKIAEIPEKQRKKMKEKKHKSLQSVDHTEKKCEK